MKYEEGFACNEDICREFQIDENELHDAVVYAAVYRYGNYEGNAVVIFEKDGQLYSVHGGHCSCYGLEGQWSPEKESWENILHWLDKGNMFWELSDDQKAYLRSEAVSRLKKSEG